MPRFDLSPEELAGYRPALNVPADLDSFWAETLESSRARAVEPVVMKIDNGLRLVDTFDVVFSGFDGQPVRAWLHVPAGARDELPAVVRYLGYGGGRGLSHEVSAWTLAGYACCTVDTRGQGAGWSPGDTPDPVGSAPAHPGSMTRGIGAPRDYYYRRVFTDAVRAVEVLRDLPVVRADRIAVTGVSQGGGMTLAVSGLAPGLWAAMPDVPFLCDFPRALEVAESDPYLEIVRYLRVQRDETDRVLETLSYFDGAVLARRATPPALFSVALMDRVCPPSTVYAAFNWYAGPKEIAVYPYNDHEGGEEHHIRRQLSWLSGLD